MFNGVYDYGKFQNSNETVFDEYPRDVNGTTLQLDHQQPNLINKFKLCNLESWEKPESHTANSLDICYNASDCTTGEPRFCNHDNNLWGYCEECSSVIDNFKSDPGHKVCVDDGFLCERGENSCIEICGGKEHYIEVTYSIF